MRRLNKVPKSVLRIATPLVACIVAFGVVAAPSFAGARQKSARTTASQKAERATPAVSPKPDSPLILVVSIRNQKVKVYDVNGEITSSRVSTGRPGFDTPTGVFSILEKNVDHRSNIYSGADMPYMERITWSGVALHAGVVPGFRASHGCIRLPYSFSRTLFGLTKIGNRVVVTKDDAVPLRFDSPKLFRPLPFDDVSALRSRDSKQQLLAVNDQPNDPASSDALQDFPRLIGISPALLRAVADMPRDPERRPTTRVEADKIAQEKIGRLQVALKSAGAARTAALDKAKTTAMEFDAANDRFQAAQRSIMPLRAAVKDAEKRQQEAIRAFETYMITGVTPPVQTASITAPVDTGVGAAAGSRESDLEDAVLDRTLDADKARADVANTEMSFAEVQASFAAAKAARDTAQSAVQQTQNDLVSAQTALTMANKDMARRAKPISVFVSLRAQRVYVRQGVDPVLEAPINVTPLPGKVGTHVFTAMRYGSDPNTFEWRLVSAQTPAPGQPFDDDTRKKKRGRETISVSGQELSIRMATTALESFSLPDEIISTISELAKPGSSLIVSDRELPPSENGDGTEFVVLTR